MRVGIQEGDDQEWVLLDFREQVNQQFSTDEKLMNNIEGAGSRTIFFFVRGYDKNITSLYTRYQSLLSSLQKSISVGSGFFQGRNIRKG